MPNKFISSRTLQLFSSVWTSASSFKKICTPNRCISDQFRRIFFLFPSILLLPRLINDQKFIFYFSSIDDDWFLLVSRRLFFHWNTLIIVDSIVCPSNFSYFSYGFLESLFIVWSKFRLCCLFFRNIYIPCAFSIEFFLSWIKIIFW